MCSNDVSWLNVESYLISHAAIEIWIAAGRQRPSGRIVGAVDLAKDARVSTGWK